MKTSIWGNFPWETGYTSAGGGRFWSSSVSRSSAVWGESHLLWGEDDISVICTLTAWHLSNLGGMGQRRNETWKQFTSSQSHDESEHLVVLHGHELALDVGYVDEVFLAVVLAEDVAMASRSAEVAHCPLLSVALKYFQVEIRTTRND